MLTGLLRDLQPFDASQWIVMFDGVISPRAETPPPALVLFTDLRDAPPHTWARRGVVVLGLLTADGPLTVRQLCWGLGWDKETVKNTLQNLRRAGKIRGQAIEGTQEQRYRMVAQERAA